MGPIVTAADEPAHVFSLAETLCDEMQARGWTTSDVAARMGGERQYAMSKFVVDLVLAVSPTKDRLIVDDETFEGLARAFDVSEQFFRNIDAAWRAWPHRRSPFEAPESLFGTDGYRPVAPGRVT